MNERAFMKMEKSEKISASAIAVNVVLVMIKYGSYLISGSMAMKAESIHSLTDVVASSLVFGGLRISKRRIRSFPYGLYKVENLVSTIVAIVIFYAGYEIVTEAIKGESVQLRNIWVSVFALIFAVGITYGFSRFEAKVGHEIGSPILIADSQHIRTDMFSNGIVLISLLSGTVGFGVDRIAAIIIAVFIVFSGGEILINGIKVLLDVSLGKESIDEIKSVILGNYGVDGVREIIGRSAGPYKFIEATLILNTNDLRKAHSIASDIEYKIQRQISNVRHVIIHYEPKKKDKMIYAVPIKDKDTQSISLHFGETPFFMLASVNESDMRVVNYEIVTNPATPFKKHKGIAAAEFLSKCYVDVLILRNTPHGRGADYALSEFGIETIYTDKDDIQSIFESMGLKY